jgi:pimeloyl-ACP methyl ester carboxylesterase
MTPPAPARVLCLPDGRTIGYALYGDPAGVPLLLLHGTPGAHSQVAIGGSAGREAGLAIIAPDRWGYGLSDVPHAPSLPAFAADMAALMDHLGHSRFAVGGISGGAPYAVATAAALPSRVTALALISPMGPIADAAVRRSLSPFHRFCFTVLPHRRLAVHAVFRAFRASIEHSPRLAAKLATLRAGPRDKALIARPHVAKWLLGSFGDGLRPGTAGPVQDLRVFARPWNVDCAAIRAPARLWIGTKDTAVPVEAARVLAQSIAGCTITELPAEGHLWVTAHYLEVLNWIAAATGVPAASPST